MTRLLYLHAHPDDETLWTGVSIAQHVLDGDEVHLITCTLGEEGEVIPPELRHLELPAGEARDPDAPDPLAEVRRDELACATSKLGVARASLLADLAGRPLRDSGMAGSPSAHHPRAFAAAEVEPLGQVVADYIDEQQIDIVVAYDEHGGYLHPDHVQAHRVALAGAARSARRPECRITLVPRSWAQQRRRWVRGTVRAGAGVRLPDPDAAYPPSVVDDDLVTIIEGSPRAAAVRDDALRCHRTQVQVRQGWFMLSDDLAQQLPDRDGFALVDPATGRLIAGDAAGDPR
ncbi:PIG-L family deacetylase [Metallococcus carri]|uniref:PIG-L family deacetylase n=1 Tax=Metallococcus carri TaxID=1656884 RepID=UPI001F23CAA3|nr:PIG-L family deacetylase [Metallococcus carri]